MDKVFTIKHLSSSFDFLRVFREEKKWNSQLLLTVKVEPKTFLCEKFWRFVENINESNEKKRSNTKVWLSTIYIFWIQYVHRCAQNLLKLSLELKKLIWWLFVNFEVVDIFELLNYMGAAHKWRLKKWNPPSTRDCS